MPKTPILSRELFYDKNRDGTYRDLDFCLVNTSLGAMVEPVPKRWVNDGAITDIDVLDVSFNRRTEMDETTMFSVLGTAGLQLPVDRNNTN